MSESSQKGKSLELDIAKTLRSKLKVKVTRDKRSGAGLNKSDISDYYRELPIHIEAKNHKTIKIKEFFKQAEGAASMGQAPTVVFKMDNEVLACLRFSDLINFIAEAKDLQAIIDDLRQPRAAEIITDRGDVVGVVSKAKTMMCREGHLADEWGYCQQLKCKYSRGYRPPKGK